MSAEIIPFQFHRQDVPAIRDQDGNPWWKAADVCQQCDLKNVSKACERLDADEKAVITLNDSAGRPRRGSPPQKGAPMLTWMTLVTWMTLGLLAAVVTKLAYDLHQLKVVVGWLLEHDEATVELLEEVTDAD